jgi:hypothetical protein
MTRIRADKTLQGGSSSLAQTRRCGEVAVSEK